MVGRISRKFIKLAFVIAILVQHTYAEIFAGQPNTTILASYSLDDKNIVTGPDTFQLFQHGKGTISLSELYRYSGYRSIQINDTPNDGDFPELQGYFDSSNKDIIYFHFAFMVTSINEHFNIALAGKEGFRLKQNGIGFWLQNDNGLLRHYSDGIPKKIFQIEPYIWYVVDVSYDLVSAYYDLSIMSEFGEKLVYIEKAKNAGNQKHSKVNMFSFVGDLSDNQVSDYYVDDIIISTDKFTNKVAFVAPGRKKLFVDSWNDYRKNLYRQLQCMPILSFSDIGISEESFDTFNHEGLLVLAKQLFEDKLSSSDMEINQIKNPHILALLYWRQGCEALLLKKWDNAIKLFIEAEKMVDKAPIISLSKAIAFAGNNDMSSANELLWDLAYSELNNSQIRVATAMIALNNNADDLNLDNASEIINNLIDALSKVSDIKVKKLSLLIDENLAYKIRQSDPNVWESYKSFMLNAEQKYFNLLWQGKYIEALRFAYEIDELYSVLNVTSLRWLEYIGDTYFFMGEYNQALKFYKNTMINNVGKSHIYLKMSDIYYLLGDINKEKLMREKIYGAFWLN